MQQQQSFKNKHLHKSLEKNQIRIIYKSHTQCSKL
jgi:hypothetical protein